MATYGGGITFSAVLSSVTAPGNNGTLVAYTVPAGAHARFKGLSLANVGGVGYAGSIEIVIQNDTGLGGWVDNFSIYSNPTTNIGGTSAIDIDMVEATPEKEITLFAGQRVLFRATGASSGTPRFTFSYLQFTAS